MEAKVQPNNQEVTEGATVTLNGEPSQPTGATFVWTQISGPAITLNLSRPSKPTFVAPQVTSDQQAVFRLTVLGCDSSASVTTRVDILDESPPANRAPTAVANASPELADEGVSVTLSAAGSSDPDTPNNLAYSWTQVSNGAPVVTLSGANSPTATFTAPQVTGSGVTLEFNLRVTDPSGLYHDDNAVVNVIFSNDSPFASLSCPMHVDEGATVMLDGSGSSDYEDDALGKPLTYTWTQTLGPPYVTVSGYTSETISFTAPMLTYGQTGGIFFGLKVTDSAGAYSTTTCGLIVDDATAPVFAGDEDRTVEATSPSGASVLYGISATDNVEGDVSPSISCSPESGSTFALDTPTLVNCKVTDTRGNRAETSFEVVVRDRTRPVIEDHGDVAVEATGPQGATVGYELPKVVDLVDLAVVATCTPPPGVFAVGSHTVTCNAQDASGNDAVATTFQVTVHDLTPPDVTVPGPITREATSPQGAAVAFAVSAYDIVDEAITPTCKVGSDIVQSGDTFPLGTHTVVCTATDHAGNEGSDSFTITVEDTTPPTLTLPANIVAEATSSAGAAVSYAVSATDIVDTDVEIACLPASGSTFALDVATSVSCTATDDAGNARAGSFSVTVRDTTPPAIAPHADVTATATGNSKALVTYTSPTSMDLVDGAVAVSCSPASGSDFNVGSTEVTCTATDSRNNTATSKFNVIVSYAFTGFFSPIDNLPTLNVVKAGQAIPVKFTLGGNQGMAIFYAGYPKSVAISCTSSSQDAIEETLTNTTSGLQYDATTGQYIYVWKTEKAWAGTCRQLQVKLKDGSIRLANFNFTR